MSVYRVVYSSSIGNKMLCIILPLYRDFSSYPRLPSYSLEPRGFQGS